ncbi:sensor histidine kinase [Halomonas cupida]|uniref:sensor histidine kinase N-terminal domain-containing protein n=1 Tax=Halomonas TaxID=2745 RepID=UPI001A8CAA6C|nr:sensor histidine kinase N-terminal domain-containing protein [Halomonas litopenaei]
MITLGSSLKRQLLGWLSVTVLLLGLALMAEAWISSQRAANRAFDAQLQAAALTIAEAVRWREGVPHVVVPEAALQILSTDSQDRVFYAVLDEDGGVLSRNWPVVIPSAWQDRLDAGGLSRDLMTSRGDLRVHGQRVASAGWVSQLPVQVWVGHTLEGRKALAWALFRGSLSRFVAMVLMTSALMGLTVRAVLLPLRRLRRQLRSRSADDFRPLSAKVPQELHELVQALDHLFARQRQGREDLLRFTADASHQLKTPLAGLKTTCELGLRSHSPEHWRDALVRVHQRVDDTSRLAGQLLSLARLRHLDQDQGCPALELTALVRDVALDWAGRDQARDHDLGLGEVPAGPVLVRVEGWALREALGNLIDNALRYTPAGSAITVMMERETSSRDLASRRVQVSVVDNGPGVSDMALATLGQPFQRAGRQDTAGSGLGLAIVETTARRMGATLSFAHCQPQGLRVTLSLPLADDEMQQAPLTAASEEKSDVPVGGQA